MREGTVGADTLEKRAERNIILCGFMGCGKSGIGRRLARLAGRSFVDMDEYIEKKAGKTIKEIFAEEGERSLPTDGGRCCLGPFPGTRPCDRFRRGDGSAGKKPGCFGGNRYHSASGCSLPCSAGTAEKRYISSSSPEAGQRRGDVLPLFGTDAQI